MQRHIITLAIAPAFLSAAIYLCLSRIVVVFSEQVSRIKPRTYALVFATCDFISLVLQAAGGAILSGGETMSLKQMGVNILITGLSTQVVSLFLFIVLGAEYAIRLRRKPGVRNPEFEHLRSTTLFKAFLVGDYFIVSSAAKRHREISADVSDCRIGDCNVDNLYTNLLSCRRAIKWL